MIRIISQAKEKQFRCPECNITLGYLESDLSPLHIGVERSSDYCWLIESEYQTLTCPSCLSDWIIKETQREIKRTRL